MLAAGTSLEPYEILPLPGLERTGGPSPGHCLHHASSAGDRLPRADSTLRWLECSRMATDGTRSFEKEPRP